MVFGSYHPYKLQDLGHKMSLAHAQLRQLAVANNCNTNSTSQPCASKQSLRIKTQIPEIGFQPGIDRVRILTVSVSYQRLVLEVELCQSVVIQCQVS